MLRFNPPRPPPKFTIHVHHHKHPSCYLQNKKKKWKKLENGKICQKFYIHKFLLMWALEMRLRQKPNLKFVSTHLNISFCPLCLFCHRKLYLNSYCNLTEIFIKEFWHATCDVEFSLAVRKTLGLLLIRWEWVVGIWLMWWIKFEIDTIRYRLCIIKHTGAALVASWFSSFKECMHVQLACTLTFEAIHGSPCDSGINHPNQYFSDSQKILQAKVYNDYKFSICKFENYSTFTLSVLIFNKF